MKKSLVIVLLGLAATSTKSLGQGIIYLDNYDGGPPVTYGYDMPGTPGTPINSPGWTAGFYWAPGNVIASVGNDPTMQADPSTLGGGLALATGIGSTAQIDGSIAFNTPGAFSTTSTYTTAGVAGGGTITMEVTAYFGSSYASSSFREHDSAFLMAVGFPTGAPASIGTAMTPLGVPEPSVVALSGLGVAALMLIRRKQPAPIKAIK